MTTQEIQDAIKARFGAQLEEWKKLHGAIKGYGSDGKIAVFRVADINTIDTCRMMSHGNLHYRFRLAPVMSSTSLV